MPIHHAIKRLTLDLTAAAQELGVLLDCDDHLSQLVLGFR